MNCEMKHALEVLRKRLKETDEHKNSPKEKAKLVLTRDREYPDARIIANSRILRGPAAVVYCAKKDHVVDCVNFCREYRVELRVRSGGHHHEGMCSADYALVIDLSKMSKIKYINEEKTEAWIEPGCRLDQVYKTLENVRRTLPGGGCGSVRVGGLTQGGGWGLLARECGLTCDNLLKAEVVLADGTIVTASEENLPDLFWALRGGGGGNFGVVTRFAFKLFNLNGYVTTFSLRWPIGARRDIAKEWMQFQGKSHRYLTTFCRLSIPSKDDTTAIRIGGKYLGRPAKLRDILKSFYGIQQPASKFYKTFYYEDEETKTGDMLPLEQPEGETSFPSGTGTIEAENSGGPVLSLMIAELVTELQPSAPKAPPFTCDGPHPHKVSSAFPKSTEDYDQLAKKMDEYLSKETFDCTVNKYVSLHGLGGKVSNPDPKVSGFGPFPYRDRNFLLQFQAWWSDPEDPSGQDHIKWISDFRKHLDGHVEGAFINFVDKFLVSDPDTQRVELLEYYYKKNLDDLRGVKKEYDPKNLFRFGMSIPLPDTDRSDERKNHDVQ